MQKIAAFDFDGTITRKDTLWEFLKFTQSSGKLIVGLFCLSPVLTLYLLGFLSNNYAKEKLFQWFFKGWSINKFDCTCQNFIPVINQLLRPGTVEKIRMHEMQGDSLIIISASIENWISPWANQNGFEKVIATRIEVDANGTLTGKFLSENCYGKEKVNRLLDSFPNRNDYYLFAYGDSKGDRELIEFADKGTYIIP